MKGASIMVSIGQNLAFRAAQLNSTQKTVKTEENTVENKTAANQAALNTSEGGAKTLMPSTELLLVNNGIKINKPEADKPSLEVNAHKGTVPGDVTEVNDWLTDNDVEKGDTFKWNGNVYIVSAVVYDDDGTPTYNIRQLND